MACKNRSDGLPKALENKKSTIEIVSKRGYDDLIESLYSEVSGKDEDLKKLEREIRELEEGRPDSVAAYNHFNGRNRAYYNSAGNHISSISDSLLAGRLKAIIHAHIRHYDSSMHRHRLLADTIEMKNLKISDLHKVVKLFKTLPLIEEYQQNNVPDTVSMEGLIQRQNEVIRFVDSILQGRN